MEPVWIYGSRRLFMKLFKIFFFTGCLLFSLENPTFAAKKAKIVNFKNKKKALKDYLKVEKRFSRKLCPGKTEQHFNRLFKSYRGQGFYVPVLAQKKLDKDSIQKVLPLLEKKLGWINIQISHLKRFDNFKQEIKRLKVLEKKFDEVVGVKSQFYKNRPKNKKYKIISKYKLISFKEEFQSFLRGVSFLTSSSFPVNHFEMRKEYDETKSDKALEAQKNYLYLKRKVFEDGAQDKNHTRSDAYFRSVLNMLSISLRPSYDLLPEFIRYDLEYVFSALPRTLRRGKRKHLERMREWKGRTTKAIAFYKKLLKLPSSNIDQIDSLKGLSLSREKLKVYVYKKQAAIYKFWAGQSKQNRVLYVIDTILQNEVGGIDGKDALDRRDVSEVVINRVSSSEYNRLETGGSVYPYLSKKLQKKQGSYPWLNVLLKRGEFSFTYYFFHASLRTFCPAQDKRSRKLRKQNLKIAVDKLSGSSNKDFDALRYFSRASMTGRIDMTQMWKKYLPLSERPGNQIKISEQMRKRIQKQDFAILYQFSDPSQNFYSVIELGRRKYVLHMATSRLYKWRDPNLFRYFRRF